jgi:hypothetical protein
MQKEGDEIKKPRNMIVWLRGELQSARRSVDCESKKNVNVCVFENPTKEGSRGCRGWPDVN